MVVEVYLRPVVPCEYPSHNRYSSNANISPHKSSSSVDSTTPPRAPSENIYPSHPAKTVLSQTNPKNSMAVCTLVITHVTSAIGMMMDTRAALLFIAMCVIVMQYNQIQCLKAKTGFHDASVHEYNNDADTIKQETNDICYVQQETNDICDDQPVTPLCGSAEEFGIRFHDGVMKVILDDLVQTVKRRELMARPFRDAYTIRPEY